MVAFFADHSKDPKDPKEPKEPSPHFVIQRQQRVLNCNQALCEWSAKGDRAVLTASSDIDRVGAARACERRRACRTTAARSCSTSSTTSSRAPT